MGPSDRDSESTPRQTRSSSEPQRDTVAAINNHGILSKVFQVAATEQNFDRESIDTHGNNNDMNSPELIEDLGNSDGRHAWHRRETVRKNSGTRTVRGGWRWGCRGAAPARNFYDGADRLDAIFPDKIIASARLAFTALGYDRRSLKPHRFQ